MLFYDFVCTGCSANFVGKSENTFNERTRKHAWTDKDSVINNHLHECEVTKHLFRLTPSLFSDND